MRVVVVRGLARGSATLPCSVAPRARLRGHPLCLR